MKKNFVEGNSRCDVFVKGYKTHRIYWISLIMLSLGGLEHKKKKNKWKNSKTPKTFYIIQEFISF